MSERRMVTKGFLLDRDGVLNTAKGGGPRPESVRWVESLVARSIPFVVATNETTSSPRQVFESLASEGFPLRPDQVHTPLSILFDTFDARPPGRLYVRGTDKLKAFLAGRGLEVVDDARVDTVVLGFDRAMSYQGLSCAIEAVLDHGARLIALHENHVFRGTDRRPEPGLGAWVRAVEYATGATALVIGKPSRAYYEAALEKLGLPAENTAMISDDPLGDLAGAKRLGMRTIFVLSGKYGDESLLSSTRLEHPPDEVLPSIEHVAM